MLELVGPEASDETGRTFRYRFPEQEHDDRSAATPVDPTTGSAMNVVDR